MASIEIAGANALVDGVQVVDRRLSEVLADLRQAGISPEFVLRRPEGFRVGS